MRLEEIIGSDGVPQLHPRPQLIPDALVVAYVQSPLLLWIALAGFWSFMALNVEAHR